MSRWCSERASTVWSSTGSRRGTSTRRYTPATYPDHGTRRLGMALDDKTAKIVLDETRPPDPLVQRRPGPADRRRPPPLHPGTGQPLGPADLAPLFPMALIMQEVSAEPRIEIPDQVRDIYRLWRPSPLLPRAPPREGARYPGPHLLQVRGREPGRQPQAEHRRRPGLLQQAGGHAPPHHRDRRRPVGHRALASPAPCSASSARSTWSRRRYYQKPYRKSMIQAYGATIFASPSEQTNAGRKVLAEIPDSPGSLGIAISEAVEDAATHDDAHYSLGSVLNHVLLHQTVIGQESAEADGDGRRVPGRRDRLRRRRLELRRARLPVRRRKRLKNGKQTRIVAAEPLGLPDPHQGRLHLRLRRHRRPDAAGQDVHPRPHLRAAGDPRRRPALPRRRPAALPARRTTASIEARRPRPDRASSRRPSSSPAPRASCRRPSRPTRSARRSTRRCARARPASSA